jgi:rhodanese-related sulfurtransferase
MIAQRSSIVTTSPAKSYAVATVDPKTLRSWLMDGDEIAVLDVREVGVHTTAGHILLSTPLPLSQLEMKIANLVPRRSSRVVVYDGGHEGLSARAGQRLQQLGYTNVAMLPHGTAGWAAAGGELFTGINVLSKAFGEHVEHAEDTPRLTVDEVKRRRDAGENMVILDSRTLREFQNFSVPGAVSAPGPELVYRFHEVVKDPDTTVVVNCAGRTRSIIGAQAIINAGVPNKVVALENGTMAWLMAGYQLDTGKSQQPPLPKGPALEEAKAAAGRLAKRFGVRTIDTAMLSKLRSETEKRSLYILDVRSPEEYEAGHLPGARWAPGGQLVQALDEWVATFNARIVLVDNPDAVRATSTASWLLQMNVGEVTVLPVAPAAATEKGPNKPALAVQPPEVAAIDPATARAQIDAGALTVVDLDPSARYQAGHIPGAYFALRSRLMGDVSRVPGKGQILLTSGDGALAAFAAVELDAATERQVLVQRGGTAAWRAAGFPLEKGADRLLHPMEDAWTSPYSHEKEADRFAAFRTYLGWEIDLIGQIERDGTTRFRTFPAG